MKRVTLVLLIFLYFGPRASAEITFDYSVAELVIEHFCGGKDNTEAIANHPGYKHILEHSKRYSSRPLTDELLRQSLKEPQKGCFDFSRVAERKTLYSRMIQWLKEHELEIINDYAKLPMDYLPDDDDQEATIYYVIGGYNGIAFDGKICMNLDFEQFRNNFREIELYISHELFHIGFEKYHQMPNIIGTSTFGELRAIVLATAMNEGLATLTPLQKRIETNELGDRDYQRLLDSAELQLAIFQFDSVMNYLTANGNKELSMKVLGSVLGKMSGDRLFYVVGCHIGRTIESKHSIKSIIKRSPEEYYNLYLEYRRKE